jgi:hypothetical protein
MSGLFSFLSFGSASAARADAAVTIPVPQDAGTAHDQLPQRAARRNWNRQPFSHARRCNTLAKVLQRL